ncbi:unnamed protein product [Polarella glacialis]|uniref:Uncharacterized protein n=1 Tax=Polarella glacialis TaxID=89957 RepID=A0A813L8Z5_POLGL|nr:unnamed protein product [Polarella glacialis]CAE8722053.1 unnamed protein product [Polarella glacialis]
MASYRNQRWQYHSEADDDRLTKISERRHFADCILSQLVELRDRQVETQRRIEGLSALRSTMDEMKGMMQCQLKYQCAGMCCSQVPQMPSVHHVEKEIPKYIEKVVEVPVYKNVEKCGSADLQVRRASHGRFH